VNVVIAMVLGIYLAASGAFVPSPENAVVNGGLAQRLFSVNIMLVIFNLLPAFPMDGGRVLRAILAMRMPYTRATQIAANIGQGLAFLFAIVGFMSGAITLLLIAFFVWTGAAQEAQATQAHSAFAGVPVASAMITEFHAVSPHDNLGQVTQMILHSAQQDFPVLDGTGNLVGLLTRADFLKGLTEQGETASVAQFMRTNFPTVDAGQMLEPVLERLMENECHTAPVLHDGRLAGLLTADNIGEFLMIHSALQARRTRLAAAHI
jgi:CBS domain-containing protein